MSAMRATGIGSLPGTEIEAITPWVIDTFSEDLPFVPELPDRGAHAAMIGRTLGLLDLPVDTLLGRWRIGAAQGLDQERARSLFRRDLNAAEEALEDEPCTLKQQFVGPFTLGAAVELRQGQSVLSDRGAFDELTQALAHTISEQALDMKRRFGQSAVIQIDEPSAPAVMAGMINTASGYSKYQSFSSDESRRVWQIITEAISGSEAQAVLHCCAPSVPVEIAQQAGFEAVAFDLSLVRADDDWARALESGQGLWIGSTEPRAIEEFVSQLGFSIENIHEQLVVSPPCGLARLSASEARRALLKTIETRKALSG